MATTVITITHGKEAVASIKKIFNKPVSKPKDEAIQLKNYFEGAAGGSRSCKFDIQVNGGSSVVASGTIIFSGVSTAADTILINGTTLTAVASGAVNNQWNVLGTSVLQAAEVARAINASTTPLVSGTVLASASASTVTLTAAQVTGGVVAALPGVLGNAVTLAKGTDAGTVMTVSGARLTGGLAASANVYHCGV